MCRQFFSVLILIAGTFISLYSAAAYNGSQAYNHSNHANTSVNIATGTFHFSYPLIYAAGIHSPFAINLTYAFNKKGMFGLPNGWRLDVDYIDKNTAELGGKQWLIDPLWHDETLYASGLKYYNHHGTYFLDEVVEKPIPEYSKLFYRFKSNHKDGSKKYFSHQGLLILEMDRFGNKVFIEYETPVRNLENARITSITDNYGNQYRFAYEPNALIINHPDETQQRIYFSHQGVTSLYNQRNQRYDFDYADLRGYELLRNINSPTGLVTDLSYDTIPYRQEGKDKAMPVVIEFKQFDIATHRIHHQTHYSYAKGNNYTGYPLYSLSGSSDSLMDSSDLNYRYSVTVKQMDGIGPNPTIHQKVYKYNFLHLPVEVRILKGDKNFLKTTYSYAISPFKYNRSTNYDKPSQVLHSAWNEKQNGYIPSDRVDKSYDRYGNKTEERHWIYDRDKKDWRHIRFVSDAYFTDHYSLLAQTLETDMVTGRAIKTAYHLSPSNKTHSAKLTFYQMKDQKDWQPWQQIDYRYDKQGREIENTFKWLSPEQPSVQSTHKHITYLFDENTGMLTTQHQSSLGNITQEVTDTRNNQLRTQITALGEKIEYKYNAIGQRIQLIDPEGNVYKTAHMTYGQDGINAKVMLSPLGFKQREQQDASGRMVLKEEEHKGHYQLVEERTYNAFGKMISQKDRYGLETRHKFDDQMRPMAMTDPWLNKTQIHYDDDNLIQLVNVNGHPYKKIIKTPWQLKREKIRYPLGQTGAIDTNAISKITTKDGFNQTVTEESALVDPKTNHRQQVVKNTYQYDASQNREQIHTLGFDGITITKHLCYDLFKNVFSFTKTQAVNGRRDDHAGYRYFYNSDNQLVRVESPQSGNISQLVTIHRYDKNGREIEREMPDGHIIQHEYTPRGFIQSITWNRSQKKYQITHHYDADSRLIQTSDSDDQKLHYHYDIRGELTDIYYPDNNHHQYGYDNNRRLTSQKNIGHTFFTYHYDDKDKGKLSAILNNNDRISFTYGEDRYGMKGRLLSVDRALANTDTTHEAYSYGPFGRLAGTSVKTHEGIALYSNTYQYLPRGELIEQVTDAITLDNQHHKQVSTYQYDSLKRLVRETHNNESLANAMETQRNTIAYQYDGNNNLIDERREMAGLPSQNILRFYNVLDQLVRITSDNPAKTSEIIHDANGRLQIDDQGHRYHYDDLGLLQLVTAGDSQHLARFAYYPDGLLSCLHTDNAMHQDHQDFYYGRQDNIQTVFNNQQYADFISHGNKLIGSVSKGLGKQLFVSNQSTGGELGSDNQSKKAATFYFYEGYGQVTTIGSEAARLPIDFLWNQAFLERATGLTYMKHRFYHPTLKRFITRDNLQVDNRYGYAHANPIMFVDPLGQSTQQGVSYGLGGGFTVLGIIGAILAVPTGGASLSLSAAAGIGGGVTGALSGLSLMGSQAALDSGNKSVAKALQYTSIGLGVVATVATVVAIAPAISSYFFGYELEALTRPIAFARSSGGVVGSFNRLSESLSSTSSFESENVAVISSEQEMLQRVDVATTAADLEASGYGASEGIQNFREGVGQWEKVWRIERARLSGYSKEDGFERLTSLIHELKTQAFGKPVYVPKGLVAMERPPVTYLPSKARSAISAQLPRLTEKLGDASLAEEWFGKTRYSHNTMTSILEGE